MTIPQILLVIAAYFIGAIPFAYIIVKLVKKIDIRTVGSGNAGATNAARVLGKWGFISVFVLDALKGFSEALREKEIEYEEKRDLSEESLIELNDKFNQIEKGDYIKIKYYKNGRYIGIKGIVTNIDYTKKKIQHIF